MKESLPFLDTANIARAIMNKKIARKWYVRARRLVNYISLGHARNVYIQLFEDGVISRQEMEEALDKVETQFSIFKVRGEFC